MTSADAKAAHTLARIRMIERRANEMRESAERFRDSIMRLRYWQHIETGQVAITEEELTGKWGEIGKEQYDVILGAQQAFHSAVATDRKYVQMLEIDKDRMEIALLSIQSWARAYPLDIFPEPDFKKVAEVLNAAGLSLDAVSASNMRHVIEGVGKLVADGLGSRSEVPTPPMHTLDDDFSHFLSRTGLGEGELPEVIAKMRAAYADAKGRQYGMTAFVPPTEHVKQEGD